MIERASAPLTPDLCVIGGGLAGLQVATAAGALGVPTVLVDKTDLCDPLPRAGDLAFEVLLSRAKRGGTAEAWAQAREAARAAVRAIAPDLAAPRLRALGVQVIRATARFRDAATLDAGPHRIRARRFVLATGASPRVPAVPGLDLVPFVTTDRILDLASLPPRPIVLGGDPAGYEVAQALGRLGAEVVLLDPGRPLAGFDDELAAAVLARLPADRVTVRGPVDVTRIEPAGAGVRVELAWAADEAGAGTEQIIEGSHLVVAAGWAPNLAEWRPDLARIACSATGVVVGPEGRTGNRRVHALGAVTQFGGSPGAAQAQAGAVLRSVLFRRPGRFDPAHVPRLLRTTPEIAVVGLSEAQARGRAGRIRVLRAPVRDNDRARAEGIADGHVKVIAAAGGRVLGAGIVGPEASELIALWCLVITRGLEAGDVAGLALPTASFSDLSRRAALASLAADLAKPWLRRALVLLRRLG